MAEWTVLVDDNFHFMDESERYTLGVFASYDAAVAACMGIVDEFLAKNSGNTAETLFNQYTAFGEDPWISGPPPALPLKPFSAWEYALRRCNELAAPG